MEFRPLAQHPAFVPIAGVVAVIAAMAVLQMATLGQTPVDLRTQSAEATQATAAAGQPSSSSATAERIRDATIDDVDLARDTGGTADAIVVRVAGDRVRLVLADTTRVLVEQDGRMLVAGADSLQSGQRVDFDVADGTALVDGATLATVRAFSARRDPA